jgi:hypothetical protein
VEHGENRVFLTSTYRKPLWTECSNFEIIKYRSLNGYIQFTGQFVVILAQSWKNSAKFAQNTNLWHFKSCITSAG